MDTKEIIKMLKDAGVKATDGDEDYTTVISWDDLDKIRRVLKSIENQIVILPRAGYDGGTIIYPR